MKVHEIMTTRARCVSPDNTLVEAAGLMRQFDIGAVPVCENDRLMGMLTDRDIAIRAVANGLDPNITAVRDVMSHGVVHVSAEQEVEDVVRMMESRKIRRVPVVNRENRLVGIVALGDIAVTSNPAFSGLALREVSESEQTLGSRRAPLAAASRPPRSPSRLLARAVEDMDSVSRDGGAPQRHKTSAVSEESGPARSSRARSTGSRASQRKRKSGTRQRKAAGAGATKRRTKQMGRGASSRTQTK